MARNGSGTYSVPNTFVSGNPITASGPNQNFSDIASEITNSVAADGQTSMTAPLKLSNGTNSAPSATFASDTNTGIYRIGADNIGVTAGGTKIVDVASTGASITGTLTTSGALTVTADGATVTAGGLTLTAGGLTVTADTIIAPVGSNTAPTYSFASDSNTGIYHIGSDNIGITVNGVKEVDIGVAGTTLTHALTVTSGFTVSGGSVSLPAGSISNAALAAPGGCVLIETKTASTSNTIDFETGLTDTNYDAFEIRISSVKPTSDDVEMWLRVGTGGTPTYQTSGYYWSNGGQVTSAATPGGNSSDAKIVISGNTNNQALGNATGENYHCVITFNNPEASDFCVFSYRGGYVGAGGESIAFYGSGHWTTAGAITGIRFMTESSTIVSGRFSLYGYKKS